MTGKESACRRWCITIQGGAGELAPYKIWKNLHQLGSKFQFSREVGELEGRKHYQAIIQINKKKRTKDIVELSNKTELKDCTWRPMSNNSKGSFQYAMKIDTRVEGPWADDHNWDEEKPRQLKRIKEMAPWQIDIIEKIKKYQEDEEFDDREINVVYSKDGQIGGNILGCELEWQKLALEVPYWGDGSKMMSFCANRPAMGCYYFDLPRATKKFKLEELYTCIEMIKDGKLKDWKFKGVNKRISSPMVWIKLNDLPDLSLLTKSRWRIWEVNEYGELVPSALTPAAADRSKGIHFKKRQKTT